MFTWMSISDHLFTARAKAITINFKLAKVPFELDIVTGEVFKADQSNTAKYPLGQLPVLTLPDGRLITQSVAIARYAGKLSGLYPSDPVEALLVDEIIDTCNEVLASAPQTPDNDLKKTLREEWAAGKLQKFLRYLNVKAAGGTYLVGGKLTLADIFLFQTIKGLRSGSYDFVPTDVDAPHAAIGSFFEFLKTEPVFSEFA